MVAATIVGGDVAAASPSTLSPSQSELAESTFSDHNTFQFTRIIARHSGKCLNVEGASQADRARVIQYRCVGASNEMWRLREVGDGYYQIIARHSGKCLNVEGASQADRARVIQYRCVGASNEMWRFREVSGGYYQIIARHSNKCLNVEGASQADRAQIIQYRCVGASNEQWR
ncbi:RICIN domain-containing protein [Kibdelosporangium aridum]|uniref:RICIN domain-containing protein n=1 Tax=Kibdelosporangium aridum TaxID=2030 RepID=UPI0035EFD85F